MSELSALVVGARHGIGLAVAQHLRTRGAEVLGVARESPAAAMNQSDGAIPARGLAADLSRKRGQEDLIEFLGDRKLDFVLFSLSHVCDPDAETDLSAIDDGAIESTISLTTSVPIDLYRRLIPNLAGRGSHVVFVSSDWALPGSSGPAVFSSAKAALLHFCRTERRRASKQDIQLSCLVLGDVATYDDEWEEPKWTLAHEAQQVAAHYGKERIALQDLVRSIDLILDSDTMRVDELHLTPQSPAYEA